MTVVESSGNHAPHP